MKAKNQILIIAGILLSLSLNAQIKVQSDNHISLGSLSKAWGLQIQPNGYTYFQPSIFTPYAWMNLTYAQNQWSKCYIVNYSGDHKFFVYGNGQIYCNGQWFGSDSLFNTHVERLDSSLYKILQLEGISYDLKEDTHQDTVVFTDNKGNTYYTYPDPKLFADSGQVVDSAVLAILLAEQSRKYYGLIAQEVERIVPEVVRTMPDGTKGVAYQSIIPLLIEAVKTQQSEIEEMRALINEYFRINNGTRSAGTGNDYYQNDSNYRNFKSFLYQNIPNPFSTSTTIRYKLDVNAATSEIYIFNIQGELLKTYPLSNQERNEIVIRGEELKAGMYLYSLVVDGKEVDTKRMILTN
ncbi:MAG: T9SS type A sorting domain-containing protein [Bacteroidales bacterium]|nr:T9SS type A sorting domain-containing protein [Bacteroidota bacterium]MBL6950562.1 T9SS type A sorting domain-containing protein [Bacteroidales bacterium]